GPRRQRRIDPRANAGALSVSRITRRSARRQASRFRKDHGVWREPTLFIPQWNCLARLMIGKAWVLIKDTVSGFIDTRTSAAAPRLLIIRSSRFSVADHRHSDREPCPWSRCRPRRDRRPAPRAYRKAKRRNPAVDDPKRKPRDYRGIRHDH